MKNDLRLLYVEDDKDTRDIIAEVLKNIVGQLYVAKDGAEALEIFKEYVVDFVISDFRMPKMNGNELCSAIKEISPDTYFVLLTAYNDTDLLVNAINAGVDQFLLKPVDGEKLFSVIDKIKDKINQKFRLDRACSYLQDAQKNAHVFYWDYNLSTKNFGFEKEVAELFDLPLKLRDKPNYEVLSTMVAEEDRNKFLDIFKRKIFNEESIDEVVAVENIKHEKKYLRIATSRVKSLKYKEMHVIGMFQDINRCEQELEILKDNKYNHMLRLDGKKTLIAALDNFINSSVESGNKIAALFFEIDNFTYILDKYGQSAADEILVELVNFIKSNIIKRLYFGRWSEYEFVIVTSNGDTDVDVKSSEELMEKIQSHTWIKNIDLMINIGLGFYEVGDDAKSLIQKADFNMLESKKAERRGAAFC